MILKNRVVLTQYISVDRELDKKNEAGRVEEK